MSQPPPDLPASPGRWFTWSELSQSGAAARLGLDNSIPEAEAWNLAALCAHLLDPLRALVGPIRITSGYRSPRVNEAIGGSKTSDHMRGWAVDLKAHRLSAMGVAQEVKAAGLLFDQLIVYHPSRGGHVHLGGGPRMRGQILYAPEGGGYRRLRL